MLPITAVILTYNEGPNIARVLDSLAWCEHIVIVDSGSTDESKTRALQFPNVSWFMRPFDNHAAQWTFAIFHTEIATDLVLALDSDMIVPRSFVNEFAAKFTPVYAGGVLTFRYRSLGRLLPGSLYPAQLRVLRRSRVSVIQRGHTQEFTTNGDVYTFKNPCIHDDRKPIDRWFSTQINYSSLEFDRTAQSSASTLKDCMRGVGVMPLIAGIVGYIRAGGPFLGKAALSYAYERLTFEAMLTLRLLHRPSSPEYPAKRSPQPAKSNNVSSRLIPPSL
jgi:hypothetical protein